MGLVADGDDSWIGGRDLAIFKLLPADVVDDVLLHVRRPGALPVEWADDVGLFIKEISQY